MVLELERAYAVSDCEELVEHCPVPIGIATDARWVYANEALLLLAGTARRDIIGHAVWESILLPDTLTALYTVPDYKAPSQTFEGKMFRRDAEIIDVEITLRPCSYKGKPSYQIVLHNVSKWTAAIDKLHKSESTLLGAQRLAGLGTWEWALCGGRLVDGVFSDETFGIYELPRAAGVQYEDVVARIHPDERTVAELKLLESFTGEPYCCEHRLLFPDGRVKYIRSYGEIICDNTGKPVRLVGLIQEMTAIYETAAALRRSEQSLHNAQKIAKLGSWEWDLGTSSFSCSEEMYRILGREAGWSPSSYAELLALIHPDERSDIKKAFAELKTGGEVDMVCRGIRADGEVLYLHIRGEMQRIVGKPVRIWGTVQDVTTQREDAMKLKEVQALVFQSEKLQVIGQFAAGLAHEIRNPLTVLMGFVRLLPKAKPEAQEMYARTMRDELERIERIVNEMLVLSKPINAEFKQVDLQLALREVITLIDIHAIMKDVQITLNPLTEPVYVNGSEDQLKQIWLNLSKNAIEAMPKGGELAIRLMAEEGVIHIKFSDNGEGMSEETLKRLGQPFYTTKEKGTGLGVLITKQIVDSHGGMISYSSEPGSGTTVLVTLPTVSRELHQSG